MNRYQRIARRTFGGFANKIIEDNPRLRHVLLRAHIYQLPEVYLSSLLLTMLVGAVATAIPVIGLWFAYVTGGINLTFALLAVPVPALVALTIYIVAFVGPELRVTNRARDIEAKLPYALNYIATMASAGSTPERIFDTLADQHVYGEIANEASLIRRDVQLLGLDVVGSLNAAIDRSPSLKWQDFLQGAITTLSSGGSLEEYFLDKSQQYLLENRQDQKSFLDNLGILAESFVTVVVAAPLFLLVLLSVMTSFGGDPKEMLAIGYILILVLLPLSQLGFGATIHYITPEA